LVKDSEVAGEGLAGEVVGFGFVGGVVVFGDFEKFAAFAGVAGVEGAIIKFGAFAEAFDEAEAVVIHRGFHH